VETVAGRVAVGQDPRDTIGRILAIERRRVVPELDEDGREASSAVSSRAVLDTHATVAGGVGHVVVGRFGVERLAVPARRESDFGREAVLARLEALGEAVGEDLVVPAVGLVAAPAYAARVVAVRALQGLAGNHVEVFGEAGDVGPFVAVTEFVVDLGRLLGHAVEAGAIAVPVQCWAPVQALVGLDAGGGARRGLRGREVGGGGKTVPSVEGVHMGACGAGLESWVNTLVAHGVASTVEEAEVVAIAVEGRGRSGQTCRESNEVGKHDVFDFCWKDLGLVAKLATKSVQ
jgi:hypothetical protein